MSRWQLAVVIGLLLASQLPSEAKGKLTQGAPKAGIHKPAAPKRVAEKPAAESTSSDDKQVVKVVKEQAAVLQPSGDEDEFVAPAALYTDSDDVG
jgi:hypothetical protein